MSNTNLSPVLIDSNNSLEMEIPQKNNSYVINSIKEKYKKLKVGDLLIFSGDEHFYQYFILISLFLMGILEGTFKFSIPFMFYKVTFQCKNENGIFENCPSLIACNGTKEIQVISKIFSLNQNFNLYCDNLPYAMYSAMIIVSGGGLLAFFIFLISEYLGRIKCFFSLLFLHIFSMFMVYVAQSNLIITVIFLTINYGTIFAWYSNVTIYLNESLGGYTRMISMPVIIMARSIGIIFVSVSFYFLPNYILNHCFLVTILASIGPCYFLMHESMFFQYAKMTLGDIYSTAKRICNMNFSGTEKIQRKNYIYKMLFVNSHDNDSVIEATENKKEFPIEQSKLSDSKFVYLEKQLESSMSSISVNYSLKDYDLKNSKKSTINKKENSKSKNEERQEKLSFELIEEIKKISLLEIKKEEDKICLKETKNNFFLIFRIDNFLKLIGLTIICSCILAANGLTFFSIQSIGFDSIYHGGFVIGVSDLLGSLLSIFAASFFSNKTNIIISQFLFFTGSLILCLTFWFRDDVIEIFILEKHIVIIEIITVFVLRIGVGYSQGIALSYSAEVFSTNVRTIAFAIIISISRLCMGLSEFFIFFFESKNINPNAAIFFFAILSFPISICLPNTSKKMKN